MLRDVPSALSVREAAVENVREEEEEGDVHSPERKAVAVTLRRRPASSATACHDVNVSNPNPNADPTT